MIKLRNDLWFNLSYGAHPEHRTDFQPASLSKDITQLCLNLEESCNFNSWELQFIEPRFCLNCNWIEHLTLSFCLNWMVYIDFCIFASIGHCMQLGVVLAVFPNARRYSRIGDGLPINGLNECGD